MGQCCLCLLSPWLLLPELMLCVKQKCLEVHLRGPVLGRSPPHQYLEYFLQKSNLRGPPTNLGTGLSTPLCLTRPQPCETKAVLSQRLRCGNGGPEAYVTGPGFALRSRSAQHSWVHLALCLSPWSSLGLSSPVWRASRPDPDARDPASGCGLCNKLCGDLLSLSPTPQPVSSSDSEAAEADRAGGSEDDEDRGVVAVTAVTAAATSDRMESDSDSDKSSDNSGLKRKAVALKVGTGRACLPVGPGALPLPQRPHLAAFSPSSAFPCGF